VETAPKRNIDTHHPWRYNGKAEPIVHNILCTIFTKK
jgi:hypothetical protein